MTEGVKAKIALDAGACTEAVDKIEADTLAEVRGNARKVLNVYRAEEATMRRAAYAALETGK